MGAVHLISPVGKISSVRINKIRNTQEVKNTNEYKKVYIHEGDVYALGHRDAFYVGRDYYFTITLDHECSNEIAFAMYHLKIITWAEYLIHERACRAQTLSDDIDSIGSDIHNAYHVYTGFDDGPKDVLVSKEDYNALQKILRKINKSLNKHIKGKSC